MNAVNFAVQAIANRIGIAVTGKMYQTADGVVYEFTPLDGHPNESFLVLLRLGWHTVEASFVPGKFAGSLISRMGNCDDEGKLTFSAFGDSVEARRGKITMHVNGFEISAKTPATWPSNWSKLDLILKLTPLDVNPEDAAQLERLVFELVVPLFGMMAALIGVEENELPTSGEVEGAMIQSVSTRYERKKVNREACIQLKGSLCTVCGFDFAEHYGEIGVGYIEIHHIKSLASLGAGYCINVATDLVPICANCHAMAHREEPPIAIDRLQILVNNRRKAASL